MGYLSIDLDQLTAAERRDLANALLRAAWSAVLQETRVAAARPARRGRRRRTGRSVMTIDLLPPLSGSARGSSDDELAGEGGA